MDDWTDIFASLDHIKIANVQDNAKDITRTPGLLKKIYMSWETNTQTLFQFKQIYTHRLKTLHQAF
jgi:hypothetical protein